MQRRRWELIVMTSFGWKRKIGAKVSHDVMKSFENNSKDDVEEEIKSGEVDWLTLAPNKKVIRLEDAITKSERLRVEGSVLAESERYWEAIKKWDEAIQLTPKDERLYEMKAQALLILCEVYPAVQIARKAVECNPTWWIAHQTLGRAQLGLGEVKLAVKSFSRAVHLNPDNQDLWQEDLMWSLSLLNKREKLEKEKDNLIQDSKLKITELDENCENLESRTTDQVSTTESSERNTSNESKTFKTLPQNYVKMRDT